MGGMQSGSYFTFPGYQLVTRHRSIWRGDWVGNFSWLRRDGCFSHLPGGPMFDLSFTDVVPEQLMVGLRPFGRVPECQQERGIAAETVQLGNDRHRPCDLGKMQRF